MSVRRLAVGVAGIAIVSLLAGVGSTSGRDSARRVFFGGGCLTSVAATSMHDVWAVGARGNFSIPETAPTLTLVEHWNGSRWTIDKAPGSTPPNWSYLLGVAASSPRDAWAVGLWHLGDFALHWNGSSWRTVPFPEKGYHLVKVVAFSPSDVWAKSEHALFHWDGTAWNDTNITVPRLLSAFGGSGPNDLWVSGTAPGVGDGLLHWDGTSWSKVRFVTDPRTGYPYGIAAISASSPTDAWAVGGAFTAHWDGTGWRRVASPTVGTYSELREVSAQSPRTAWAAGSALVRSNGGKKLVPLVLHWNGSAWRVTKLPTLKDAGELWAVTAIGSQRAWAVGCTHARYPVPLVLQRAGASWKRISIPIP